MKTAMLIGAGFSYDLGMPISRELTEVFLSLFDAASVRRLINNLAGHEPYSADRPINKKAIEESFGLVQSYKVSAGQNYEELLSGIQDLGENPGKNQSDKDSYHYVFGLLYEIIHDILSIYQKASYEVLYPINKRWFSKLDNLLSDDETWVFSLNHDLFLECLAIDMGIPVTYGGSDILEFPISNLEMEGPIEFSCIKRKEYKIDAPGFIRDKKGINLIKLHGSLSEHEYKDGSLLCNPTLTKTSSQELIDEFSKIQRMAYYHQGRKVPSGKDRVITNKNGELDLIGKAMLTGGRKYSKTAKAKEGEEKLIIFDEILSQLDRLTIIGYGFGDKHVNFRISNAMARRGNLAIEIIDPIFKKNLPDFLEPFDFDSRIVRASCGAAHWMDYCKSQKWDAEQISSLKENAKLREVVKTRVESILKYGNQR